MKYRDIKLILPFLSLHNSEGLSLKYFTESHQVGISSGICLVVSMLAAGESPSCGAF